MKRDLNDCPRAGKFAACTDIDANKCQCASELYGPCPCSPCHDTEDEQS